MDSPMSQGFADRYPAEERAGDFQANFMFRNP